jgi:hypothetical protein
VERRQNTGKNSFFPRYTLPTKAESGERARVGIIAAANTKK